jgi:hypothetical protein
LEFLAIEDVGIYYGHLAYVTAICYVLWSFGAFTPFWYVVPRKIWQPWHSGWKPLLMLEAFHKNDDFVKSTFFFKNDETPLSTISTRKTLIREKLKIE